MDSEQARMEQALKERPELGRYNLAKAAGVTENIARLYLNKARYPQTAPKGKVDESPKSSSDPFDNLSADEKKLILKSLRSSSPTEPQNFEWTRESFKFAAMGDTHMGHIESKLEHWRRACDLIWQENCDVVLHTGDITEGMSGREGHIYELEAIGATAQLDLAENRFKLLPCDIYALNGNHDLWGFKRLGLDIAQSLAGRLPNFHNLGMHEADFPVGPLSIKLWHGEDGASYATSYRTQKFIEGLSGGEKPNILLAGHDHKSIFHMCRNVAAFGTGTLCGQTMWMRNKKLAAHVGFWIIEVFFNESGIERLKSEWIPFFK